MRLKNKIAIIVGSSRGLGLSIAKGYKNEGAKVVITYLEKKEEALSVYQKEGFSDVFQLDIRCRESLVEFYEKIKEKYKKIDILVNNAGINRTADFIDQTDDEWDSVIETNLTGVFRNSQEALNLISDGGKIINIGSLSGEYGGPRTPSYAAAKMGIMALTHNLARFLADRNICVNCLSPGVIAGEFTEDSMSPEVKKTALKLMLLKRFAKYEEMVGAAIFLASDDSSYLTAQTISVNGGAHVRMR
ncbi:MAG: SDR family oxidoreductase [Pseudomonadota bacterium]|nr:SDR family oxidoreductase [Pseudomonadota bacterium]